MKTPHIFQAAIGAKLEGRSQTYTELDMALTQNSKNTAKYGCHQSSHIQASEKKKCQYFWCQGPQAKLPETSELFSFYSSYQC